MVVDLNGTNTLLKFKSIFDACRNLSNGTTNETRNYDGKTTNICRAKLKG
jgi:hypothetical protein